MKQKKKILGVLLMVAIAFTMLTACSVGDEATADDVAADREVRLTARLDGRGLTRSDAATPLANGTAVDVYFNGTKVDYTVSGSEGTLAPVLSGGKVYWPASDQLTIYAVSLSYTAGEVFTVAADQTAASPASDLCYSHSQVYTNTGTAVPLSFTHQLAKVNVTVSQGTTSISLPATVRLNNVLRSTTLDYPGSETVSPASATGSQGITISCPSGSAIIPPQTLSAGEAFIILDYSDGGDDFTYTIPAGGMTFEGGMEYTYNLTLSDDGMQYVNVTYTISPWTAKSGFTANQVSFGVHDGGLAGSGNAEVGQIICEHGYLFEPTTSVLSCGGEKVAVVAYVGSSGDTQEANGNAGGAASLGFSHGLALALQDCDGTNCNWSDPEKFRFQIRWCNQKSESCLPRQATDVGTAITYLDGLASTKALVNSASHEGAHYAAIAANTYQYSSSVARGAHPENTSDWFLPSLGQCNLMAKSMCGTDFDIDTDINHNFKASEFNPKIVAAGGVGVSTFSYWSSTASGTDNAMFISPYDGYANTRSKSSPNCVRAVLAF